MVLSQSDGVDSSARNESRQTRKRRGILAAAAASIAGIAAKQTAQPVAAAATMQFADTSTLVTNAAAGQTQLNGNYTPPVVPFDLGMWYVNNVSSTGSATVSTAGGTGYGVYATSTSGVGSYGQTGNSSNGTIKGGVVGVNTTGGNGVAGSAAASGNGVLGTCNGDAISYGVAGYTDVGKGLLGSASGKGYGVYAFSQDGNGIFGTTSGNGSVTGTIVAGVYGASTTSYGIIGNTTASGYSGLTAITATAGVAALAATSTVGTAYAAYFQGTTVVQGNFAVGGGSKSAAVPHSDGSHRLVYCVESPEAWFEDFGEGKLANGTADVQLDRDFAAIVHTDAYQVFLTGHDVNSDGLVVAQRRAAGFLVKERKGGTSSGTFSWRVVAKRKDIKGERLAKFDLPKINTPDPAKLPKPEPVKKP